MVYLKSYHWRAVSLHYGDEHPFIAIKTRFLDTVTCLTVIRFIYSDDGPYNLYNLELECFLN